MKRLCCHFPRLRWWKSCVFHFLVIASWTSVSAFFALVAELALGSLHLHSPQLQLHLWDLQLSLRFQLPLQPSSTACYCRALEEHLVLDEKLFSILPRCHDFGRHRHTVSYLCSRAPPKPIRRSWQTGRPKRYRT